MERRALGPTIVPGLSRRSTAATTLSAVMVTATILSVIALSLSACGGSHVGASGETTDAGPPESFDSGQGFDVAHGPDAAIDIQEADLGSASDAAELDGACVPSCEGRACGQDGCGGSCGGCDPGARCLVDEGRCTRCPAEAGCLHGGSCVDREQDWACDCPDGWRGPSCQVSDNPCVLSSPAPAFDLGPAVLPIGDAVSGALTLHKKAAPYAALIDRIAVRLASPAAGDGTIEVLVTARSGDVHQLVASQSIHIDPQALGEQEIGVSPRLLVPALAHVGLYNPAGALPLAHAASGGAGYWEDGSNTEVPNALGALFVPVSADGAPSWRAALVSETPCANGAACVTVGESFECQCPPGYGGLLCESLTNPCDSPALNHCDPHATCQPVGSAVKCTCEPGFVGDGATCEDVDECTALVSPCDAAANCTNLPGSFMCACKPGFVGNGEACQDVDECSLPLAPDCGAFAFCQNLPGGFDCPCLTGYAPAPDGVGCVDIDECQDPESCGQHATCNNTGGSFECVCDPGYVADGAWCADRDECKDPTLNDCDDAALCENLPGSFVCTCAAGYVGDGKSCCGAPFAEGDTCEDAFEVCALPYSKVGLTVAAANNYGAGIKQCNSGVQGAVGGASADVVFRYAPATSETIAITLAADYGASFYVVTDCGPISQCVPDCAVLGSSCVAAQAVNANESETRTVPLVAGLTYFIVVDGQGSLSNLTGSYTLSLAVLP